MRKGKKQKTKKDVPKKNVIEISETISDVKTFIDNFKADVNKKRRDYQSYAQKFRKKKV
ncbi:MAG: hypothetical protein AABX63_01410 [Nanoarchaeota archaeon]